jgi:hypothetical protein
MNLKKYLQEQGISMQDFAFYIKCSESVISKICAGFRCSKKIAGEIENFTRGTITSKELRSKKKFVTKIL